MKATFFLAIAFLAAVVSARDITQVQQGGTGGSDNSAKGLVCIAVVVVHAAVAHIYYVYRLVSRLPMVTILSSVAARRRMKST